MENMCVCNSFVCDPRNQSLIFSASTIRPDHHRQYPGNYHTVNNVRGTTAGEPQFQQEQGGNPFGPVYGQPVRGRGAGWRGRGGRTHSGGARNKGGTRTGGEEIDVEGCAAIEERPTTTSRHWHQSFEAVSVYVTGVQVCLLLLRCFVCGMVNMCCC